MDKEKKFIKKSYEKPRLRTIELVAEEVLAPGCKSWGDLASGGVSPPCTFNFCSAIGS
jgi:hypothetical protein